MRFLFARIDICEPFGPLFLLDGTRIRESWFDWMSGIAAMSARPVDGFCFLFSSSMREIPRVLSSSLASHLRKLTQTAPVYIFPSSPQSEGLKRMLSEWKSLAGSIISILDENSSTGIIEYRNGLFYVFSHEMMLLAPGQTPSVKTNRATIPFLWKRSFDDACYQTGWIEIDTQMNAVAFLDWQPRALLQIQVHQEEKTEIQVKEMLYNHQMPTQKSGWVQLCGNMEEIQREKKKIEYLFGEMISFISLRPCDVNTVHDAFAEEELLQTESKDIFEVIRTYIQTGKYGSPDLINALARYYQNL